MAEIVLQPVVGGVEDAPCDTRASENFERITEAVELLAGPGRIRRGMFPMVLDCAEFSDDKGHIAPSAREALGNRIADCYAD